MTVGRGEARVSGIYEQLGIRPVINAAGTVTRNGGAPLAPEVVAAMADAARACVRMEELQEAAGRVIAEVTGAEAGYVTSGAAAGLTLAAAACLARLDVARMDQLPDTTGIPNEIIVQKAHRNAYDHAIRASGARFVEVGYLGYPGAGGTFGWQIEAAINERTVALLWSVIEAAGVVPFAELSRIGRKHNLPVIVDASAALPPAENLRRFIAEGADLVSFSGGKAILGPQATGILCGKRELIESVLLQHQDVDVHPEVWSYRAKYLDSGILPGPPHQGLGRGFKVGKEEIAGLVVALKRFVARDHGAETARWSGIVNKIVESVGDIDGVKARNVLHEKRGIPQAVITLNQAKLGFGGFDAVKRLDQGEPRVAVSEGQAREGTLTLYPIALKDEDVEPLTKRLRAVLTGAQ